MWGVVTTLIADKAFGFISTEGAGKYTFFHSESLVGVTFSELRVGDVVAFEVEEGQKGPAAVDVQRNGGPRRQDELQLITSDTAPEPDAAESGAVESIRALTDEVLRRLSRNPVHLYQLHPKVFEELVAEIFISEGFATEPIKSWNQADGGIDIVAVRRDIGGFPVRYAIQCKRYAANRLVTADPIRALAGVLDRFHAHVGVVATTSYFTKPARDEVEAHFWTINLRDYESIVAALRRLEFLRK